MTSTSRVPIWRKSSHSTGTNENCVEVAPLSDGMVAIRDSKDPDGATLTFTSREWRMFLMRLKSTDIP